MPILLQTSFVFKHNVYNEKKSRQMVFYLTFKHMIKLCSYYGEVVYGL